MIWLFWSAAGLILYTYLGYAAWLWVRAWFKSWPVQRGPMQPFVSIVMVVRNEEQILEQKMQNLLQLRYPPERYQIVVVSDGSSDRTAEILKSYAHDSRVLVMLNPLPSGKACGLNDALSLATGEIVVLTDARQMIEPQALAILAENFADAEVGCVSGELMLGDPTAGEAISGMGLYWRLEKMIRVLESRGGSVVGATGALYAVRREFIPALPPETILDDVYIPMEVVRQGKRVVFEPNARAWDTPSLGTDREFERKVRTLSGNYQLVQLLPWLLSASNPIRLEFISHKLLRLVVPFALAVALVGSLLLPGEIYRSLLLLQVVFYGLGCLAWFRLSKGLLGRLADVALTFVLLNTAAAVAFLNFVTGRKVVWSR